MTKTDTGGRGEGRKSCGCIAKVNAELANRNANTEIVVPFVGPQRPFIETMKADNRSRGKPAKVFATFCPFCGVKYPAERAALQAQGDER